MNQPMGAIMEKLEKTKAAAGHRERERMAETPNGWIKHALGFRQFSLRGLEKARADFERACLARSFRKLCSSRANGETPEVSLSREALKSNASTGASAMGTSGFELSPPTSHQLRHRHAARQSAR